jgi:hypothetical protein
MKLSFRHSGGFGGLILGCELDTEKLPPAEAETLVRLVRQASLDTVGVRANPQGRDLVNYEIVVEDDDRSIKASFDDLTMPVSVRALMDFLNRRAGPMALRR